jgi:hypothetical protein
LLDDTSAEVAFKKALERRKGVSPSTTSKRIQRQPIGKNKAPTLLNVPLFPKRNTVSDFPHFTRERASEGRLAISLFTLRCPITDLLAPVSMIPGHPTSAFKIVSTAPTSVLWDIRPTTLPSFSLRRFTSRNWATGTSILDSLSDSVTKMNSSLTWVPF